MIKKPRRASREESQCVALPRTGAIRAVQGALSPTRVASIEWAPSLF
jgi:hypothetical protein